MTLCVYDVENIKTSSKNVTKKSSKFNFLDLKKRVEEYIGDTVVHVAFMPVMGEGSLRFKKLLESNNINTVVKRSNSKRNSYKGFEYKYYDNDMDAHIVNYMLRYGKHYDNIILVSGDKDLAPALKSDNKFTVAIAWKDNMSKLIKEIADEYVYLEELLKGDLK